MIVDTSVCLNHPFYPDETTADSILRSMDSNEVDVAVLFPCSAAATYEFREANRELAAVLKKHPDRFIGFGVFNPFKDIGEVERMAEEYGFKGTKFLTGWGEWAFGFKHFGDYVVPFAREVAKHGLIMSIEHESRLPIHQHVSHDAFIADAVPELRIILSRCWSWHLWRDYITVAKMYPSFLLEFALAPSSLVGQAIEQLGADRLLLGSWHPEVSQKQALGVLETLELSEENLTAIRGGNAANLLGLEAI